MERPTVTRATDGNQGRGLAGATPPGQRGRCWRFVSSRPDQYACSICLRDSGAKRRFGSSENPTRGPVTWSTQYVYAFADPVSGMLTFDKNLIKLRHRENRRRPNRCGPFACGATPAGSACPWQNVGSPRARYVRESRRCGVPEGSKASRRVRGQRPPDQEVGAATGCALAPLIRSQAMMAVSPAASRMRAAWPTTCP
jgi:hypothetical protein